MVAGLIGAAIATTPPAHASLVPPSASHSITAPRWLHVQRAPARVTRDACGTWPKFGLGTGKDMRGKPIPGVYVTEVNERGQQITDGAVVCEDGTVSLP